MFTIIIIALVIWVIVSALTPEKKNEAEVARTIRRTPSVYLKAMQKESGNINTFNYENGWVTITMANGRKYSGHLGNLEVTFLTQQQRYYNSFTKMYVNIGVPKRSVTIVFGGNNSVDFPRNTSIFSDSDWDRIYKVLEGAQTIYRM